MKIAEVKNQTWLLIILASNIISTLIHYSDNYIFFNRYPAPVWMQPYQVYTTWLILTPLAIAGYFLYRQDQFWLAYGCLLGYSITSVSSIGHYVFSSPGELTVKMNIFICTDFLVGIALISFIFWSLFIRQEWRLVT